MQVRSYRTASIYHVKGYITTSFAFDKLKCFMENLFDISSLHAIKLMKSLEMQCMHENPHSENVVLRQHSKLYLYS